MLGFSKKRLLVFGAFAVFLVTAGVGCKGGDLAAQRALEESITIEWWGVFDTSNNYQAIINEYQASHPNIQVNFRKLRFDEYEQALLESWARGQGPDIFYVHNSWMGKYQDQLAAMPDSIKLPATQPAGFFGNDVEAVFRSYSTPSLSSIKDTYVDAVYKDVVREGEVYGLPVALDTMVLYYNRALLDQAGILSPPRTWQEVADAAKRLTRQNELGEIVQSGVALGTVDNIPRSSDILVLLMFQNGGEVFNGGSVVWADPIEGNDASYRPGPEALRFYTDFANLSKVVYTWNQGLPNAQEMFSQGRLGMMLGYAYQLPSLRAQGPAIDLGIAPAPHINPDGTDALRRPVNLANYWIQGVSNKTQHSDEVWDFMLFLTSQEQSQKFVDSVRRPSARRDVLNVQLTDPEMAPFAQSALTARGWYQGRNPQAAEAVVGDLILDVLEGRESVIRASIFHARRLEQTL